MASFIESAFQIEKELDGVLLFLYLKLTRTNKNILIFIVSEIQQELETSATCFLLCDFFLVNNIVLNGFY